MSDVTRIHALPDEPGDDDHSVLSAYLDDELTADDRAQVEARLAESPVWRAELDEVRVARVAVRDLPMREMPDGFIDRLIAGVESSPDAATGVEGVGSDAAPLVEPIDLDARRARRRRAVGWMVGSAAAVVIALAMFVLPGRDQVRPNVTAVATQHAASDSDAGNPISGLIGLAPMRGGR